MKFRLSLWPPKLELETQQIEQVSTIDLMAAMLQTMSQIPFFQAVMIAEAEGEE
ncbi:MULTISPECIES: hypothetical protein [Nocardia]|uniref:hypothetical protein n=1 Tax=Nocardia TaxID=1817 RepID=UPI0013002C74|nr:MULTISPECIES: hypothetical protein [Nocardia]